MWFKLHVINQCVSGPLNKSWVRTAVRLLVQERAASLEYCPWCTSKGLTYTLRSYRINLQESITLCTNPQCLFPLVSRSLEDVLAGLVPVEPTVGNKRKNALALEKEELIRPVHKCLRSSDSLGPQSITDALVSPENGAVNIVNNGHHAAPKTEEGKVNGYRDSPLAATTGWESLQYEDDVLVKEPEMSACADGFAPPICLTPAGHLQCSSEALLIADADEDVLSPHRGAPCASEDDFRQMKSPHGVLSRCCILDPKQSLSTTEDIYSAEINTPLLQTEQKSLTADITACKDIGSTESEMDGLSSAVLTKSEELVSVQNQPFWRNSDNLCWLDSLLVALVNCQSLRKCKPKDEPQQSSVWQLMRGYEDVCASIQVHQQTDGAVGVPNHVLQKADADLHCLRMSVFKLLQPKLHCKLGQRETPVFAMPLLLQSDSWVEPLFQSTFHWEFKCSECKTTTKERVIKTLPTFTNVLPDWCPLDAVHLAPCNMCCQKNQRRTMKLERLFALHFVEGLPDNDVRTFAFAFKEKRYSVTTVIQYNHQLKHFVTWICNSDGSWLEYDDMKHPECKTHQKLLVPAQEMHVVFWEGKEDKEPRVCSPSSTFAESPPSKNVMNPSQRHTDLTADTLFSCDRSNVMDTMVAPEVDTSIGSTTLLDTFEGLSQNDIITLTLEKIDSEIGKPVGRQMVKKAQQASPVSLTDASPLSTGQKGPPQNARWSFLLSKHPLNQVHKAITKSDPIHTPTSVAQVKPTPPTHCTPEPERRPQKPAGFFPKPQLKTEDGVGLPLKAAEMYGGFGAKSSNARSPFQPIPSNQQTSLKTTAVVSGTLPPFDTDALRYKLIKKLKAKKKKLAKLNEMLGLQGGASRRPDSTDLGSPNTVTSSTYDGSICADFLSDLLSPATTASNLSPDSTGFLEMLTNGHDGADQVDCGVNAVGAVTQTNAPNTENFLEEFLSQAVAQAPTEMETEALNALELFV
uniref:Ubiquitin specific peptidase like 1 n=1 Tax=Cyclopterus lumpus TaxID=8103 RepID=A0A8C2ZA34_CYCLU